MLSVFALAFTSREIFLLNFLILVLSVFALAFTGRGIFLLNFLILMGIESSINRAHK